MLIYIKESKRVNIQLVKILKEKTFMNNPDNLHMKSTHMPGIQRDKSLFQNGTIQKNMKI